MKPDTPTKRSGIAAWLTHERLRERLLARGAEVPSKCHQFNYLSLASFDALFQALRDGKLAGFRSELDVRLGEVG